MAKTTKHILLNFVFEHIFDSFYLKDIYLIWVGIIILDIS